MLAISVAWLWTAAMTVQGESVCPRPDDVARALDPLLSPSDRGTIPGSAELVPDGPFVRLRLLRPDGTLVSEKQVPAEPSCAAMAETVAVVLAAWVAQLQADMPYAFEMPVHAGKKADGQPPVVAAEAAPAPAPEARRWKGTVGAGLFASFQPATLAPALAIDVQARRANSAWGGMLGLFGTGAHAQSLDPGSATWRRIGASAGVSHQHSWRTLSLDEGVALMPALLFVQGNNYSESNRTQTWDLGAEARVRLGVALGRVEPWIEVGATGWFRSQVIDVTGIAQQRTLPRFEAQAGAGIAVHWAR
jgi:hypothetical protein